jgi:hypothetical protein
MFKDAIEVISNLKIIGRVSGKKVPSLCREGHNIWVNLGRQFLPEVISPLDGSFNAHYNDSPVRVVRYMGVGIGGEAQTATITGDLATHYPGQNTYDDEDLGSLSLAYLERPVKVTGTAGVGTAPGVWMNNVAAPPTFSGTPIHKVEFEALFLETDLHLSGAYPSVPLSEVALMLSDQVASRTSEEVYDYVTPPAYINTGTRQRCVAYHDFTTLTKTASVTLEIHWELQF